MLRTSLERKSDRSAKWQNRLLTKSIQQLQLIFMEPQEVMMKAERQDIYIFLNNKDGYPSGIDSGTMCKGVSLHANKLEIR